MDNNMKDKFIRLWCKYFSGVELPIIFYYSDKIENMEVAKAASGHSCVMGDIVKAAKGKSICLEAESIGCFGGKRYLGFSQEIMPNFEYFLSYGIPGKLEGERYKKSPEMVQSIMSKVQNFIAPAKYIVFKRWDMLEDNELPAAVIFLVPPDVLAGLFTLANYDESDLYGVTAPFSAGCGSIVQYPYLQLNTENPKAILGMFDVSARPFVPHNVLSFTVPMNKFMKMVDNMEESFLITQSWDKVHKRIKNTITPK